VPSFVFSSHVPYVTVARMARSKWQAAYATHNGGALRIGAVRAYLLLPKQPCKRFAANSVDLAWAWAQAAIHLPM